MNAPVATTPGLRELMRRLFPASEITRVELLGPDAGAGVNEKAKGYGCPVRVTVASPIDHAERIVVVHTALSDQLGHDRRADRAAAMLLAWDTTRGLPRHVQALDVGVARTDGTLSSLADGEEFYLVTTYEPGTVYAQDLRRIAENGTASPGDLDRTAALACYLLDVHEPRSNPLAYRRAIRDLLGSGEGIFGVVNAYGMNTPGALPDRLEHIEHQCLRWRWKLRGAEHRLRRTHGDFHPFNVVFREGTEFSVLDASRGCVGDPADDLAAMSINYLFFCIERPESWRQGLAPLWYRFWEVYLAGSKDGGLLWVVPPFLAWRALVVACPLFYPSLSADARSRLLRFVERTLEADRFDITTAEELFQ